MSKPRRFTIWKLRNRLLVAYLFIGVVPVALLVSLAVLSATFISRELAVYLVTSELGRRIEALHELAANIARASPRERALDQLSQERYPGITAIVRESGRLIRYPANSDAPPPIDGWPDTQGIVGRGGEFYIWSYRKIPTGDITISVPLTREFLSVLVPKLGAVDIASGPAGRIRRITMDSLGPAPASRAPAPLNRIDSDVRWLAAVPAADWEHPGKASDFAIIFVRTRPSAIAAAMFNPQTDVAQGVLPALFVLAAILFLFVEAISLFIGIRLTRNITGAVHRLYEGTRKVAASDFSYRIDVSGNDQLAQLSNSFNGMTESIERLLVVSKEKERLQSEIEIAREVQSQLYPRQALQTSSLRVRGICQPARVVSGDYFDYQLLRDAKVAIAIGDVAGKGISAALLMAALQSSLRTQLQNPMGINVSTSELVTRINAQLYATTASEKFATLCIGVFDDTSGVFTYTNAGHLPAILVRQQSVERLDVNGTIVGAFPSPAYGESRLELERGDLLAFFTDGITELENEQGEMFGEDRLEELVSRNVDSSEDRIIDTVLQDVRQWTAAEELQDDITLLLARWG